MKKALIIRYCAFGDAIHFSHLPRLLKKEGYNYVHVDTNTKGLQILANNPHIDKTTIFEQSSPKNRNMPYSMLEKRWEILSMGMDKVINLTNSIEYDYIAMEDQAIYYQNTKTRRDKFGHINYYDICIEKANLPDKHKGTVGEMYFKTSEKKVVEDWVGKYMDRFIVLINLSGSSLHKRFMNAESVARKICDTYKDALIITTGDKDCEEFDFKIGDSVSMVGKGNIRQAILLSGHVSLVIGCESGLMVGADMFSTPTIQLMTAANYKNHSYYNKNSYPLQSRAKCSPCHKGPYKYIGCPMINGYPECVYGFLDEDILEKVKEVYDSKAIQIT